MSGVGTASVLDHAHDAVVSLDDAGRVTYWNPSAERIFGLAAAEAHGRPVDELIIPPRLRDAHRAALERFLAGDGGGALHRRLRLSALRRDGAEVPIEMTITAESGPSGWSFTAFITDRSDRMRAEAEREALVAPLRDALQESELRFEAIVGTLTDAVTIRNREHRLIYANQAALTTLGFASLADLQATAPETIMSAYRVFAADGTELSMARMPSVRILEGQSAEPLLLRTVHRESGAQRWQLLKAAPLRDVQGEVQATIMLIEDVTEQQRAERQAALLARAGEVLSSSLDYEQTLQNVADLAVSDIVDWCAVDLVDGEGGRRPVAVAHIDPDRLRLAEELRAYEPAQLDPDRGLGLVFRTGEPIFYPEIPDDLLAASAVDARHLELLRAVGMRSVAIVPLSLGGRTLGALTLVSADSGRLLDEADVGLARQLAGRAVTAIENARLYSQRTEIAHTLQQSLLPRRLPEIPGYELASAYLPAADGAEVGGDFYDVWRTDAGWMLTIGDVTGKGAGAAALTSLVRHTLRTASAFLPGPAALLGQLNRALIAEPDSRLCTVICLHLDPVAHAVTLAVGGHPLPLRVGAGTVEPVGHPGVLLGAFPDAVWVEYRCDLEPDTTLLFYTDGVTDTHGAGQDRYGPARLDEQLRRSAGGAAAIVDGLVDSLRRFRSGAQTDDTAVLALGRREPAVPGPGAQPA